MRSFFFFLFFVSSYASAEDLGKVILQEGPSFSQNGELQFGELDAGEKIKVNAFSQYRGPDKNTKIKVKWDESSPRTILKPGAKINLEQIIETGEKGWLRVFFKDDSIVDIGPNTLFSIQNFEMNAKERHILFRLLQGKVRILVVRKLDGRSTYQVTTPGALVSVKGTDFIVSSDISGSEAHLKVIGVRGQITVDLKRQVNKGEIYFQPIVVNTYSLLSVNAIDGYALDYTLEDKIPFKELGQHWDNHAPYADPLASPVGTHWNAARLPGTGIVRADRPAPIFKDTDEGLVAELAREHPENTVEGLTPSHNFRAPVGIEKNYSQPAKKSTPYVQSLKWYSTDRLTYEVFRQNVGRLVKAR